MGEPSLYICDSAGPYTFSISRGRKSANLERFEDQLRLYLRYGIAELHCHIRQFLICHAELDIRTRLDHREYFEVHYQKAS